MKSHEVKSGRACLAHTKNGRAKHPYDSRDQIDAFLFGFIFRYPVQTGNGIEYCYFLLYCEIPMDVMIKHKMVKVGKKGGKKTLCVHPGIYEQMLTGSSDKTSSDKTNVLFEPGRGVPEDLGAALGVDFRTKGSRC